MSDVDRLKIVVRVLQQWFPDLMADKIIDIASEILYELDLST